MYSYGLPQLPAAIRQSRIKQKLSRGIALPSALEPFEVHDEQLPNGDGVLLHRYYIDTILYSDLEEQMRKANASTLPFGHI
jgi:hypothetical protein